MSGIVGGAGSKSGIIGSTELDYEEGLWTPAIAGSWGGSGHSFTAANSTYTKIGRMVYCRCNVSGTSMTGSNDVAYITGLPFSTFKPGMGTQHTNIVAQGTACSPQGPNVWVGTFTSTSTMYFSMFYEAV